MNIIKLKDIVMPSDCRFSRFFNENLKGKYAYWVKMRFIFPMNSLDYKTYIQYEQLDNVYMLGPDILPHIDLYSEECCMYNFAQDYIDHDATELANAVSDFRTANDYVADADIDINKLRRFRSWLAAEILALNTSVDGSYLDVLPTGVIHMLEYYSNNCYNEVVKQLSIFGKEDLYKLAGNSEAGCGCCGNSTSLYKLSGIYSGCDALSVYTNNVHNLMVQTFENADFWSQFNKDFIKVFKKYIDNIIKTGLVITTDVKSPIYVMCNCSTSKVNAANEILKNLSDALQYIIDDEIKGHVNFIHDALFNWADQLYDYMYWEIK